MTNDQMTKILDPAPILASLGWYGAGIRHLGIGILLEIRN